MVRIKNNKLVLALLLLLPLSSQAQKLQQENTKKPRRVYFMPITFGEFRLMPDTTIESSFNIGMINGVTKQLGLSLGVVSNINHNLRGIQMILYVERLRNRKAPLIFEVVPAKTI